MMQVIVYRLLQYIPVLPEQWSFSNLDTDNLALMEGKVFKTSFYDEVSVSI